LYPSTGAVKTPALVQAPVLKPPAFVKVIEVIVVQPTAVRAVVWGFPRCSDAS
jgi:hypothetical protein